MGKRTEQITVLSAVRDFIKTCPYLDKYEDAFALVDVEDLGENPTNYMIESVPIEPYIRKYQDGSGLRQFAFVFASRELSADTQTKLDNSGFYEDFERWIEKQDRDRNYPILNNTQEPQEIKVTLSSYVFDQTATSKQYQIQCRLKYYEKLPTETVE